MTHIHTFLKLQGYTPVKDAILSAFLNLGEGIKVDLLFKVERFICYRITIGDKSIYHINWDSIQMSQDTFRTITIWLEKNHSYAPSDNKDIDAYIRSNPLSPRNRTNLAREQILRKQMISLRHNFSKQRSLGSAGRIQGIVDATITQYNRGESILALADTHSVAPTRLLRGILQRKRIHEKNLDYIFRCRSEPEEILSGNDLEQFKLAELNDDTSGRAQLRIDKIAADNERKFLELFDEMGIKYIGQDELITTQTKESGRAVATPDLLFVDEVYINGERIHWIDYKNYIGMVDNQLYISTCAQVKKYSTKWGKGAICYKDSSVAGVSFDGAAVLDASMIVL